MSDSARNQESEVKEMTLVELFQKSKDEVFNILWKTAKDHLIYDGNGEVSGITYAWKHNWVFDYMEEIPEDYSDYEDCEDFNEFHENEYDRERFKEWYERKNKMTAYEHMQYDIKYAIDKFYDLLHEDIY